MIWTSLAFRIQQVRSDDDDDDDDGLALLYDRFLFFPDSFRLRAYTGAMYIGFTGTTVFVILLLLLFFFPPPEISFRL